MVLKTVLFSFFTFHVALASIYAQCDVRILTAPNWCCNAQLKAGPQGGIPPFSYEWSTGEIGPYKDSACTGTTYYVTMTDDTGCTSIDSVSLPLDTGSVRFSTINAPCSTCTGSIVLHRTITTCQGYSIGTDPPVPIGPKYFPGTYIVTYSDACGCEIIDTVVVGVDTTVGIGPHPELTGFRQYGNTVFFEQAIKEIRLYDLQGRLIREYVWTRRLDLDDLVPGMYLLQGVLEDGSVALGKMVIAH